jgi:orotate phosphoribosyltransferase
MQPYKQQFIKFLVKNRALQFGDYTLKSGRKSPYFINTGVFETGEAIGRLGYFYASLINDEFGDDFDVIFGPAYKGISLVVATMISLQNDFKLNKYYTFNRKEVKIHGEKKSTVGHELQDGDRIILIDDVITDGATKLETVELINNLAKVEYKGLVVAVNRLEKTTEGIDAFKNIEDKLNFPVKAIVTVREIIDYLTNKKIDGQVYLTKEKARGMEDYLKEYGV